tara:strand:- start:1089 stop:1208 length:120 start_codon:yes stop_codon:yes gene_type:complete
MNNMFTIKLKTFALEKVEAATIARNPYQQKFDFAFVGID